MKLIINVQEVSVTVDNKSRRTLALSGYASAPGNVACTCGIMFNNGDDTGRITGITNLGFWNEEITYATIKANSLIDVHLKSNKMIQFAAPNEYIRDLIMAIMLAYDQRQSYSKISTHRLTNPWAHTKC